MRKFKYVKKFNSFDEKEKVNEEIGWETFVRAGLTGLSLSAGAYQGSAKSGEGTISLQQAMQMTGGPSAKYSILTARSTSPTLGQQHYAWYDINLGVNNINMDLYNNLPKGDSKIGQTRYLVGTLGDIIDAMMNKEPIYSRFKYITLEEAKAEGLQKQAKLGQNDVTDFLKVGDKMIEGEGILTIDMKGDRNQKIVAAGNGLWCLGRSVVYQRLNGQADIVRLDMGTTQKQKGDFQEFESTKMIVNTDKSTFLQTLYYTSEASITEYRDFHASDKQKGGEQGSIYPTTGRGNPVQFLTKSDDEIAEEVMKQFNSWLTDFVPRDNNGVMVDASDITGFKMMTKEESVRFIEDFKNSEIDPRTINSISGIDDKTNKEVDSKDPSILFTHQTFSGEASGRDSVFHSSIVKKFKEYYIHNYNIFTSKYFGEGVINTTQFTNKIESAKWKYYVSKDGKRASIITKRKLEGGTTYEAPKQDVRKQNVEGEVGKLGGGLKKENYRYLKKFINF